MKELVGAFNQEKALVGAFSVTTNLRMELFQALVSTRGLMADGLDSGFIKNDSVTIQRSFYCQGWLDCFPEISASVVL